MKSTVNQAKIVFYPKVVFKHRHGMIQFRRLAA